MHSVARLFFGDLSVNIQASWPKLGVEAVPFLLNAGCNDAGGVLMKESITRAAGGEHGQRVDSAAMRALVSKANDFTRPRSWRSSTRKEKWLGRGGGAERIAVQRSTLYGMASAERGSAADRAAEERRGEEEAATKAEAAAAAAVPVSASSPRAA